jgi:drug/metabolite transporter (DMT)-like permease
MHTRTGVGVACALAAASIYGLIPNLARLGFENGVPGVEATLVRTSVIALVLGGIVIFSGQSFRLPRGALPSFILQSIATAIVSVSYLWSVQYIPVGLAVIIFFTFPVIILLAAPMVEGHRPGLVRVLIACVAFAGLAIAIGASIDTIHWGGLALAASSSAGATMQFFSGRSISRYLPPAVFGSLVHIVIWPVTLAIALWWGGGSLAILSSKAVTAVGYAAVLGLGAVYVAAYFAQMQSLRNAPASGAAPYFNLEPVVTTLIAALALGERLTLNQYVGGGLVRAALAAASLPERRMLERR